MEACVFVRRRLIESLRPLCSRRAFTILELLVAIVVIGLLAGLLLPAVQKARESARRLQCSNHLHQIGLACQTCQDTTGRLPPGWLEKPSEPSGWGWAARILSQLEEPALAESIRLDLPVDAACHDSARRQVIATLRCPSDHLPDLFLLEEGNDANPHAGPLYELAASNYVGMFGVAIPDESPPESGEGPLIGNRAFRLEDLRRGTSLTLLVGERTGWQLPSTWVGMDLRNEEGSGRIVGCANLPPNHVDADECEFSSRHPQGAQFVFADGHVELIKDSISLPIYQNSARRQ